jgi:hypothetical protein
MVGGAHPTFFQFFYRKQKTEEPLAKFIKIADRYQATAWYWEF